MGTFIELVRGGELKGPQQQKFDLAQWDAEFNKIPAADEIDVSLHKAGIWFEKQFNRVRGITNEASGRLVIKDPQRLFVGMGTQQWIVVNNKIQKHAEKKKGDFIFPQELGEPVLESLSGSLVGAEGIIEVLVDGIRFPLSIRSTANSSKHDLDPEVTLRAGHILLIIGQIYHVLEQLWLELVWNDFRFTEHEHLISIGPSRNPLHLIEALSSFRRESRQHEAVQLGYQVWRYDLESEIKERALKQRKLFTIIRKSSGKVRIKVSEASHYPENSSSAPISKIFLTHDYTDKYITRSFSVFKGLRLEQMIDAYDLLSQLPKQMLAVLPPDTGVTSVEMAMNYAPEFDPEEILKGFQKALNISVEQSRFLLDYMTFPGTVREQLWFKPIISLPNGKISVLLPAIAGVHFFRLVDRLLKDIPNAETEMGTLFENHVRTLFKKCVGEFKYKPELRVFSDPLKFRISDTEFEEIDLVFALGNKIYIGESKASLYPVEPLEKYNYLEKLRTEAVPQVTRKVSFVKQHISPFLAKVGFPLDASKVEIFPLVVTNNNLFCCYSILEVPVCDVLLLTRYFHEGNLERFVYPDESGNLIPSEVESFYSNGEEAIANFNSYLERPPQITMFEKFAKVESRTLMPSAKGEKPSVFLEFVVRPDFQSFKEKVLAHQKLNDDCH